LTETQSLESFVPVSIPSATEINLRPISCSRRTRRRISAASRESRLKSSTKSTSKGEGLRASAASRRGIGSMRRVIRSLKGWRRTRARLRKGCGLIRHPSHRGSIARPGEGNHSTCQTLCRSMLRLKAVRPLLVHHSWELSNKTPDLSPLPDPSPLGFPPAHPWRTSC
jgi:hypothetical protein